LDNINSQNGDSLKDLIVKFITQSPGLELRDASSGEMAILQLTDGRSIRFDVRSIEEVLSRQDADGRDFLQVNFIDGKKILITEKLVGFKPAETAGLDLKKLPKVVTTPDLVSVIEAIEESLSVGSPRSEEVDVLKRVYDSVLNGAVSVGFELDQERSWLNFIANNKRKASA
jgi:hypothetical protein